MLYWLPGSFVLQPVFVVVQLPVASAHSCSLPQNVLLDSFHMLPRSLVSLLVWQAQEHKLQ